MLNELTTLGGIPGSLEQDGEITGLVGLETFRDILPWPVTVGRVGTSSGTIFDGNESVTLSLGRIDKVLGFTGGFGVLNEISGETDVPAGT